MTQEGDRTTPVDGRSTVEIFAGDIREVKEKVGDAQISAKRTYDLLLLMNERDKSFEKRISLLERTHIVLPIASTLMAIAALFLIFVLHH